MGQQPGKAALFRPVAGMIFSLGFTGFFILMVWHWVLIAGVIKMPDAVKPHEVLKLLKEISNAQTAYYQKSDQFLGQKQYASFLPHLWITPDHQGRPIALDLVSKRIALAVGRETSLNGYFFVDVHLRYGPSRSHEVDYQRQWAIAAIPSDFGSSGAYVFLADETGKIHARHTDHQPDGFPLFPLKQGWVVVNDSFKLR